MSRPVAVALTREPPLVLHDDGTEELVPREDALRIAAWLMRCPS